jgi:rhamnose transport system ATP-binding protein
MERRDGRHSRPGSSRLPGAPTLRVTGLLRCPEVGAPLVEVDLTVDHGQVHGLAGESAATSALVRLLAGDMAFEAGRIAIEGREHTFDGPARAQQAGIWTLCERVELLPELTIAETITRNHVTGRQVADARPARDIGAFLHGLGLDRLEPAWTVGRLRVADQRLVEIARAAYHGARVIVLDRLEGGWAAHQAEPLHEVLGRLVARGVAVVYVTQRREEIYDLCDAFTVLAAARGVASVVELGRSTDGREDDRVSWPAPVLLRSSSV